MPGFCGARFRKMSALLAVAAAAGSASLHGAEIHEAAEMGNLDKIRTCLSRDATQINSQDAKGRTVLARGILSGKKQVVEFLLGNGATEDTFAAATLGHTDKLAALLKEDPKRANAKDSTGRTPLHWAAFYGQSNAVQLLLAEKADVNALDEGGFTALHWAAMFDKSDVAQLLVTNKADLTIKVAKFRWTPLQLAVIHGHVATARALLDGGADPNAKDELNPPALHQAVIGGNKQLVELLLARKADINAADRDGDTALDEAIEFDRKPIIALLRQLGAKQK